MVIHGLPVDLLIRSNQECYWVTPCLKGFDFLSMVVITPFTKIRFVDLTHTRISYSGNEGKVKVTKINKCFF